MPADLYVLLNTQDPQEPKPPTGEPPAPPPVYSKELLDALHRVENTQDTHVLVAYSIDSRWQVRRAVAESSHCPGFTLSDLSMDSVRAVRTAAISNPHCPGYVLRRNCTDNDVLIRQAVARNPRCRLPVLQKLIRDPEEPVRKAVIKNPGCPVEWWVDPPTSLTDLPRMASPTQKTDSDHPPQITNSSTPPGQTT